MSNEIGCSAGCRRTVPADEASSHGWSHLQITNRWRCSDCERELTAMSGHLGTPSSYQPDPLPQHSIGALKKLAEQPELKEKPQ